MCICRIFLELYFFEVNFPEFYLLEYILELRKALNAGAWSSSFTTPGPRVTSLTARTFCVSLRHPVEVVRQAVVNARIIGVFLFVGNEVETGAKLGQKHETQDMPNGVVS